MAPVLPPEVQQMQGWMEPAKSKKPISRLESIQDSDAKRGGEELKPEIKPAAVKVRAAPPTACSEGAPHFSD